MSCCLQQREVEEREGGVSFSAYLTLNSGVKSFKVSYLVTVLEHGMF